MAVYDKRTQGDSIDQGVWSHCEITWQRYYVSCSWVAVVDWGDEREELVRSPAFRWRKSGAPNATPEAVSSLAALEEWLVSEGWEPVDEPREAWYALRFRRPLVPLASRIAPYHSDDALTAFVDRLSGAEPTDVSAGPLELVTSEFDEYEAEIEAVEPAQANGTDPGSRRDDREAEERLAVERAEAERAEASRREAEWLEAVRREGERLEAARLEAQRLEIERLLAERREAERLEIERLVAERRETERLEDERLEVERREAEYLELERLEAEREAEYLELERLEAERLEAERLAAEQEFPLRNRIISYAPGFESNFDVRRHYGGPSPELDPARFQRKRRRRRR